MIEEEFSDSHHAMELLMVLGNLSAIEEELPEMGELHQVCAEVRTLTVQCGMRATAYRALDVPKLHEEKRQTYQGECQPSDGDIDLHNIR